MINEFNKSNPKDENIVKKIRILNELRTSKKQIIINHKSTYENTYKIITQNYFNLLLLWIINNNTVFILLVMISFNSSWEDNCNTSFSRVCLFFNSLTAAYLLPVSAIFTL